MTAPQPLWISEADVTQMMTLPDAIAALEKGLRMQADGTARNMHKTHVTWGGGATAHAIGAVFEGKGIVGAKSWAHTPGGAAPLLVLWDAIAGHLLAVIEAFALGQMRTAGISGVATACMARPDAVDFALIGTGKQALTQLAAIAAVRKLKRVRVYGPDPGRRAGFVDTAKAAGFDFEITAAQSVEAAVRDASIVTTVTRAREPILSSAMVSPGTHINAIGAITPERVELAADLMARAGFIAADDPAATRCLSREFRDHFGDSDEAWGRVNGIGALIANRGTRPADCDLSIFKAMGMGISDLALGIEIYSGAKASGRGLTLPAPVKSRVRLT